MKFYDLCKVCIMTLSFCLQGHARSKVMLPNYRSYISFYMLVNTNHDLIFNHLEDISHIAFHGNKVRDHKWYFNLKTATSHSLIWGVIQPGIYNLCQVWLITLSFCFQAHSRSKLWSVDLLQTDRQTDTQTDIQNRLHDSHQSWIGNYNKLDETTWPTKINDDPVLCQK